MTDEQVFKLALSYLTEGNYGSFIFSVVVFLLLMFKEELKKLIIGTKPYNLNKIAKNGKATVTYLNQIKEELEAKRVTLYQFKNGSHYFSHQPVLQLVPTHTDTDTIEEMENFAKFSSLFDVVQDNLERNHTEVVLGSNKYKHYEIYLSWVGCDNALLFRVVKQSNIIGVVEVLQPETNKIYQAEGIVKMLSGTL